MIENREMAEFARNLWENYIKFRNREADMDCVSFYKAEVTANPGNGKLTIQRPFDAQAYSVQAPSYMAEAAVGTQVLVLRFGDGNNLTNHYVFDNAARTMLASAIATGSSIAFPITIANGGTGASTLAGAKSNLGVPSPSDASPNMDGTASAGILLTYSRGDHTHPADTTKANKTEVVTDISYNATSNKIQQTINGIVTDVLTLASVATSGSYNDLSNKPTIPTKTSELTNDSGFATADTVPASASVSGSVATFENEDGDDLFTFQLPAQGTEIFIATYGSTSYADVDAAYAEGKAMFANAGVSYAVFGAITNTGTGTIYHFYSAVGETVTDYSINPNGTWSTHTTNLVPASRTVNGKALSSNITLTAEDVGALPDTTDLAAVYYATSDSQSYQNTATVVNAADFTLEEGVIVAVKFTYANARVTQMPLYLDVNSTGSKQIFCGGSIVHSLSEVGWKAGEVVLFVYDGTRWNIIGKHRSATTSDYGITILSSATNSTSNSQAATSAAVKSVSDSVPASASVSNGVVTFANGSGTTLFTFSLPVYNGEVS